MPVFRNVVIHGAGLTFNTTSVATTYTASVQDCVIECDGTSAIFTVSLPAAASIPGHLYFIKKIDSSAHAITVDPNASETIDGALTYSLSSQWQMVGLCSDGTNWIICATNTGGGGGSSGFSGYSGYSGPSGGTGTSGFSGYSGYSGPQGTAGTSGVSGYSGTSGVSGYSGTSGVSGYSGPAGAVNYTSFNTTTNTSATTELFQNGSSTRIPITADSVFSFNVYVVARNQSANESAGWQFVGLIKKDTANTTALIGAVSKTIYGKDDATWDVTVSADSTNDALKIAVNGSATKTIKWQAKVYTDELTF